MLEFFSVLGVIFSGFLTLKAIRSRPDRRLRAGLLEQATSRWLGRWPAVFLGPFRLPAALGPSLRLRLEGSEAEASVFYVAYGERDRLCFSGPVTAPGPEWRLAVHVRGAEVPAGFFGGLKPVSLGPPAFAALAISSDNELQAGLYLSRPEVADAIAALCRLPGGDSFTLVAYPKQWELAIKANEELVYVTEFLRLAAELYARYPGGKTLASRA